MANRYFSEFVLTLEKQCARLYAHAVALVASPPGSPAMGVARFYSILGASAVSNTGSSVITGNLGVSPGSAVTGFPPGVISGAENIANASAAAAQAAALAAYTDLQARAASTIATELGGQSLSAGVYHAASGTFQITGGLTLTLTGSATDIFVFRTDTTLITGIGAGGLPVITLAGGALAQNVYWAVGSSATINSAASSAGAIFKGNVIAQASITATQVGVIDGSLIALTGAVTLSAANAVLAQPFVPSNPVLDAKNSKGIKSIVRNGIGLYTVTFGLSAGGTPFAQTIDTYVKFLMASCVFLDAGVPAAPMMQVVAANPAQGNVQLQFRDYAGNAADPVNGEQMYLVFDMANSTAI